MNSTFLISDRLPSRYKFPLVTLQLLFPVSHIAAGIVRSLKLCFQAFYNTRIQIHSMIIILFTILFLYVLICFENIFLLFVFLSIICKMCNYVNRTWRNTDIVLHLFNYNNIKKRKNRGKKKKNRAWNKSENSIETSVTTTRYGLWRHRLASGNGVIFIKKT